MQPPEQPREREGDLGRLSASDGLVLVLGTLLFVDTFLPWYGGSTPIIELHFSLNAWDLGGRWMLVGLLGMAAALLAVLPLVGLQFLDPKRAAGLIVLAGGAALVFSLLALAVRPGGDAGHSLLGIDRAPALYVAPLLAAGLLIAALRKAKEAGV